MKNIKNITIMLLVLILTFSLAGCGEIKKAESSVNGMFQAFKNLNFEEAQKYVNVDDITNSDKTDENTKIIMETVFGNLDYEIIASNKVDNSNVIVKTKITATDMKPIMSEFFTKAMQYAFSTAFSSPQPSEEEQDKKMEEFLVECASKPGLATVTNEVDIKVVKNENKEWKIETDEAFTNALLGGLMDATKELENSFNSAE